MARRSDYEAELDAEIRHHMELHAEDLEAEGVSPAEARRQARQRFGTVDAVKEACREATEPAFYAVLRDLRHGFARLRRRPGFTAVALVTLAVCIGANSAIFSLVDAVLLRPLPYPEADRLARVHTVAGPRGDTYWGAIDGRSWEVVRDGVAALESAPFSDWTTGVNLVTGDIGEPTAEQSDATDAAQVTTPRVTHVQQQRVGAGFFSVLGVEPTLGRSFLAAEDRPGGPAVVVLSHALWRDDFAADQDVLGRRVTLRGEPYTVVGVMPEGFRSTTDAELWTPLRPSTQGEGGGANYGIIARLAPDASWRQARSQLAAVSAGRFPAPEAADGETAGPGRRLAARPLQETMAADMRQPLLILWMTVGGVLLIGCVNLAGLLLAQGAGRRGEIATRMAIGGGPGPIVRQLLAEGLALGLVGGAAGLALSVLAVRALEDHVLATLGLTHELRLDARVVAVTILISVVASLLFSAYPAWRASRLGRSSGGEAGRLRAALAAVGRTAGGSGQAVRRALLVAQVAVAVVLLVGASLLAGSFGHLRGVDPGFQPEGLLAATVSLDDANYDTSAKVDRLLRTSLAQLETSGAVEAAAVGLSVPYERPLNTSFRLAAAGPDSELRTTNLTYVTAGYFDVLGTPVVAGRGLREADGQPAATPAALVNRAFADTFFEGASPLDRTLTVNGRDWRVVGIVGNLIQRPGFGDYEPVAAVPAMYVPVAHLSDEMVALVHGWFSPSWVVRTSGASTREAAAQAIREALRGTAPGLPVASLRTFGEIRRGALRFQWLLAVLMTGLAAIALLLTAVGLAGLVGGTVQERQRALGISLALGATRSRAVRSVVLPILGLTAVGLALGAALGPLAGRLLRGLLWGVSPDSLVTLAAVTAGMLAVALAAALVPALRIAHIDPARSLRAE